MFFKRSAEPIRLEQDYPCPCNCGGRLTEIALTEAMGCFHCDQLFVLVEDGKAIARPTAHPWTGWRWRWTGKGWYRSSGAWLFSPVGLALLIVGALLVGGLFYAFWPLPNLHWFLGLVVAVCGLLLLLILVTLISFRA